MVRPILVACCLTSLAFAARGPAALAEPPQHAEWELTFRDEFDGEQVDWQVWESEAGPRGVHVEGRWPENNVVRDGVLYQLTKKEDPPRGGRGWSTAHIWTRRFEQQYGYFEARVRYGAFLNNAFWVYRPEGKRFTAPPFFEIDINEGHTPSEVDTNFHYSYRLEGTGEPAHFATPLPIQVDADLAADFHVYGLEWTKDDLVYYFDGRPIRRLSQHWAHATADVRLSTVIMVKQLAEAGREIATMDGVNMATDWVRVYRKTKDLATPDWPKPQVCTLPTIVYRPAAIEGVAGDVLMTDDFATPGPLAAPWRTVEGEPKVVAGGPRRDGAATAGVLRLEPRDFALRMLDRPVDRLEVTFDYHAPSGRDSLLLTTLGPQFDPAKAERLATAYYTGDVGPYVQWKQGYISYFVNAPWTPAATWKGNRWNKARLLVDFGRGLFDLYDGASGKYVGGGSLRSKAKAAAGIVLRHHGLSGIVYVDNLSVRELRNQ